MLLECVPNVSEGRDPAVIAALGKAIAAGEEAFLLDTHSDPDHHRTVFTFAGSPRGVQEGAWRLIRAAAGRIDITRHDGVHPRMGAVDVCPFVPLGATPMSEAVAAARALAERSARELAIPVYLYGEAALKPERRKLPHVRLSSFAALARAMAEDPGRAPDLGPGAPHPTFGAIAIGARPPLVAYNVDLASADPAAAEEIAGALRERDGGLPHVRALGFPLASRGRTQVSMNLVDGERTPPAAAFEAAARMAERMGVPIARSELVGLIPRAVVARSFAASLRLEPFARESILEERIEDVLPLASYLDKAGARGGGAVAADVGAIAAALLGFAGAVIHKGRVPFCDEAERLALRFHCLSRADKEAYEAYAAARRASGKSGPSPEAAAALEAACRIPLKVIETARDACALGLTLDGAGSILADCGVAAHLLAAAARSAKTTLDANLRMRAAAPFADRLADEGRALLAEAHDLAEKLLARAAPSGEGGG
ncbi:MAG TPA: glutamate formimidoyltransferase [Planctomycetes bacterium]|nr:glutamate formimidoyltransferase [Planctomycetota bacterium]